MSCKNMHCILFIPILLIALQRTCDGAPNCSVSVTQSCPSEFEILKELVKKADVTSGHEFLDETCRLGVPAMKCILEHDNKCGSAYGLSHQLTTLFEFAKEACQEHSDIHNAEESDNTCIRIAEDLPLACRKDAKKTSQAFMNKNFPQQLQQIDILRLIVECANIEMTNRCASKGLEEACGREAKEEYDRKAEEIANRLFTQCNLVKHTRFMKEILDYELNNDDIDNDDLDSTTNPTSPFPAIE